MDGHAPLLAAVGDAPLRVKTGDGEVTLACYGGALRVSNDGTVSVLVEDATPIEEIDLEGVRRRLAEIGDRPENEGAPAPPRPRADEGAAWLDGWW